MIAFLRKTFPEADKISTAQLDQVIEEQITRARGYGFETENQMGIYVVTAWLVGEKFDTENKAAEDTLKSKDVTPDYKADWLQNWTEGLFEALEEKG